MPKAKSAEEALPPAVIERKISLLRRKKVMRDSDLAVLYEVETKQLNKISSGEGLDLPSDRVDFST